MGTVPGRGRLLVQFAMACCVECLKAERQEGGAAPVGEEAEVADANEAFGEQVQQEAAQELIEGQGHQFLFIVMSGVASTKGDLVNDQGNESMVGDGDAMGVVA